MANYRVLNICNDQKLKIRYDKTEHSVDIEFPNGYIISGPPENIVDQINSLLEIIQKLVPTGDNGEHRKLDISAHEVKPVELGERVMYEGDSVDKIVEVIANTTLTSTKLKSPDLKVKQGNDLIKKHLPDFRPEDASDLLDDLAVMASIEFKSDIAAWTVVNRIKEKTELLKNK